MRGLALNWRFGVKGIHRDSSEGVDMIVCAPERACGKRGAR